jgi:hypothetical protein
MQFSIRINSNSVNIAGTIVLFTNIVIQIFATNGISMFTSDISCIIYSCDLSYIVS